MQQNVLGYGFKIKDDGLWIKSINTVWKLQISESTKDTNSSESPACVLCAACDLQHPWVCEEAWTPLIGRVPLRGQALFLKAFLFQVS